MPSTLIRKGKVRDVYDLGNHYLMVASDRISAFDHILPSLIPDKGRVLTQISKFWFEFLDVPNHVVSTELDDVDCPDGLNRESLEGRSMVVKKCQVVPIECVVRGYLVGSGWRDYVSTGSVCGIQLEKGLKNCAKFQEPLFTPATKAESGHDENVSLDQVISQLGPEVAEELKRRSIEIYVKGRNYAAEKGIILADTKFEWGWFDDQLILIDEILTPDSSRFWPADHYEEGRNQVSFDKQFVREFLDSTDWDKNSPPPPLPEEIISKTREKYIEAFERLTESTFQWK
ncbi:MAG: phosphoribosylaminoimidazolesuccinocarboxamide synthase [Planctomycetota bacterium]